MYIPQPEDFVHQFHLLLSGGFFQTISYMAERVVGQGSFGVVFQVSSLIALDLELQLMHAIILCMLIASTTTL